MPQREPDLAQQVGTWISRHRDVVEIRAAEARHLQAGLDRLRRKSGDVLDPAEALLLDRGDELAVAHEDGRDVAVIRVDAEDVHRVASGGKADSSSRLMSTSSRYQNACSTWNTKPCLPSRNPRRST